MTTKQLDLSGQSVRALPATHPSMVTGQYDDSDNWSGKRWARAIAEHRGKARSLPLRHVVPVETTSESCDDFELPAFLRRQAD